MPHCLGAPLAREMPEREESDMAQAEATSRLEKRLTSFSGARKEVLQQHADLRVLLRELCTVSAEGPGGAAVLRARLDTVRAVLHCHVLFEDMFLAPILEKLDAWGPVRLQLMRADHDRQSELLRSLEPDPVQSSEDLARLARNFADLVLADMAAEERDVLDSAALCDELVDVAPESE
jgi:iron-sulfur cluster repair protein YtfE (RIC family)